MPARPCGAAGANIADFTLANDWNGGHSRSPRAGRHPYDLVQSRRRRRKRPANLAWRISSTSDVKGTAKNPTGHFSRVVATLGGQENAFTSNDYTAFTSACRANQLKT